ncbi:MAG: cell envelope biogenesis protein OmpA [Faecalibacterium sp.]
MPNEKKRLTEKDKLTPEELEAQQNEKFRTFFSTSVAQVPERMNLRDDEQPEPPKKGWFSRLFRREKAAPDPEEADPLPLPQEMPTGEIRLGESGGDAEEAADLELMLESAAPAPSPAGKPVAKPAAAPAEKPKAPPAPHPAERPDAPAKKPSDKASRPVRNAPPEPLEKLSYRREAARTALEQCEDAKLRELQEMIETMSGTRSAPAQRPQPEPERRPQPKSAPAPEKPQPAPMPGVPLVFAQEKAQTRELPPQKAAPAVHEQPAVQPAPAFAPAPEEPSLRLFGTPEDELAPKAEPFAPAASVEEEHRDPAPPREQEPELSVEAADAADAPVETADQVGERLRRMSASLTLRCVLSALLAAVLLGLGLTAEGLVPPLTPLDPVAAPAAFYGANLLLLAAAMTVAYSVLRDGLAGLWGRASAETMPALASIGALIQAVIALLHAESYQASSLTLLSGVAALGLFLALLGSRVMLAAVRGGYELADSGVEHQGAYRVRDKEMIRTLAQNMEQKDPWVLFSRPTDWDDSFVEQSLAERAGERRARKTSWLLLGAALLSGILFLIFGAGLDAAAAAAAAVLCLGAPLSSTLIAGLASLRLQRTAGAVGAVVPGWAAIEELGGIDTILVSSEELFTQDSAVLEDIRIFKGGRIDRAILYSASVLSQTCNTLRGLFRQIIEGRTDILFPAKDLELHRGLGFSAWCDNQEILIGTREYMNQREIPVPEQEYEDEHSQNGRLQILYLAVSGSLYAMFVLRYVGGRNAARGLAVLQRENIRLLVYSQDPSLTARHIAQAYHLPEDMVALVDESQCQTLISATAEDVPCCMLHLKGFVSLTGGLRAAEQAQTAETSATTVQIVSVWFSVLIALLLTTAGSIGTLSVAAVLMYQAAWSALSIAICALKQHG